MVLSHCRAVANKGSKVIDPISVGLAFFVAHIMDGILGNEAHQVLHASIRRIGRAIDGDPDERLNHDIARNTRLAHLAALEQVLDAYAVQSAERWERQGQQPVAFMERAVSFCRDQRRLANTDLASLQGEATVTLEATIDSLLAHQTSWTPAGERADAMGTFAEEAVLTELRTSLSDVTVPDDFVDFLRPVDAAASHPFLTFFKNEISLRFKSDARFRDIVLISGMAEVKAQGFEITEILFRVEKTFGVNHHEIIDGISKIDDKLDHIDKRQARLAALSERQLALLERQQAIENTFLFKMSQNISEILDHIMVYDSETHVEHLRLHYDESRYHVFVEEFYKLIGSHSPGDFIFFIELLLKAANPHDKSDWHYSDANRLSISIALCLCKNLRLLWRMTGAPNGNVETETVCQISMYILPTFTAIISISKLYKDYDLDRSDIQERTMRFRKYFDFFLAFRLDLIEEFPDAAGFWGIFEELRHHDSLDSLWNSEP
jgi:hypothetical protein